MLSPERVHVVPDVNEPLLVVVVTAYLNDMYLEGFGLLANGVNMLRPLIRKGCGCQGQACRFHEGAAEDSTKRPKRRDVVYMILMSMQMYENDTLTSGAL